MANSCVRSDDAVAGKDGNNYLHVQYDYVHTAAASRVAVNPGDEVSVTTLFRHCGNTWDDTRMYIDFYAETTGYTPLASSSSQGLPNANWGGDFATMTSFGEWTKTSVVPDGASYVGVRFVTPRIWQGAVEIDNVRLSVTAVPEPASLAVIGLAGLLLGRRRAA